MSLILSVLLSVSKMNDKLKQTIISALIELLDWGELIKVVESGVLQVMDRLDATINCAVFFLRS